MTMTMRCSGVSRLFLSSTSTASSLLPAAAASSLNALSAVIAPTAASSSSLSSSSLLFARTFHSTSRCLAYNPGETKFRSTDEATLNTPKQPSPVYDHLDTPGSLFQPNKREMNRRDLAFGIGTPSQNISQGVKPRRKIKPWGLRGIEATVKTRIDGPKELGHTMTRIFSGKVTSTSMNKTIAVEIAQYYKHPKYRKYVKTSKKFLAHDEAEECRVGDVVEIRYSRKFSKRKHFTLHKILAPKLPIDMAAQRFMDHQPSWKQQAAIEEAAEKAAAKSTA